MAVKMIKTAGILFLVLLFAAGKVSCTEEETVDFAFGPFSLGETFSLEEAKKHFGEVLSVKESYALETAGETLRWNSLPWRKNTVPDDITRSYRIVFKKITFIVIGDEIAYMHEVSDENLKTDRGVGVGDPMEKAAEAYTDFSLEKIEREIDGCPSELFMFKKGSLTIYFIGAEGRITNFTVYRPFEGKITALQQIKTNNRPLAALVEKAIDSYGKNAKMAAPVSVETELVCGPFFCGKKFELHRAQKLFGEILDGTKYVRHASTLEILPFTPESDMKFEGNYDIRFDNVAFRIRYDVIESMESQDESVKTARGLGIGDSLEKVLELYGPPRYFDAYNKAMVYEAADAKSWSDRFKVSLQEEGRVVSFEVEKRVRK